MSDDKIIGMTLAQAREYLQPLGLRVRANSKDGKPLVVTRDYDLNRVNVALKGETIVSVSRRG